MKRHLEIAVFFIVTSGLLLQGRSEKQLRSLLHWNSLRDINFDTTGLIRLIEADSFNLSILPPSTGVQFYKEGIIFLSSSKNEVKMISDHISFGAIEAYYGVPGDSSIGKQMIFSQSYSFSYPVEAVTFSPDFNTMYFTKFPKKNNKEKIYLAKFTPNGGSKSGWLSEKVPMDFCSDNYSYTHPTLSADEREMIFASDKEGSLGGMDLFITRKDGDKWSAPENLGNLINTSGNEFFPFLDSDNNLFYSSDNLPGYGGFDIFTCKFNGESWEKPVNLSNRINSENDDIAFTIAKADGKTAFYTKRLQSDKSEMQLFRIKLNNETTDNHPLTISYIFNGEKVPRHILTAEIPDTVLKVVEAEPEIKVAEKVAVLIPAIDKTVPEPIAIKPETKVNPPEVKSVIIIPTIPTPVEQKDVVIYRVQILSSSRPQTNTHITIDGKSYKLYEYFYLGEYRYTVGEFTTLAPAIELQRICRQSWLQAFVAAFKNNSRSLDLKLFK